MSRRNDTADHRIARLGSASHGVVRLRPLLDAGVTEEQIRARVSRGSLIRKYRGVFRVGHAAPSVEAEYLAAVWACGERALLCGLPAAYIFGVIKGRPPPPEVTAPTRRCVEGVITHHRRRMERREAGVRWGIPVTKIPRILVDLAGQLSADDLARACHEADVRHGITPVQVEEVLERHPNAAGARKLREAMNGDAAVTLSALERRFLKHLRAEGLPLPRTNRPAGGRYVDCRWPERGVTVELDSYRYHRTRHAWEQDRRREREAYARGDAFRRFTWGDVCEHPRLMLAELHMLLG